jgi:Zn-dependent M16 (insulinase) family peptidase
MDISGSLIPFHLHGGDIFNALQRNRNLETFKSMIKQDNFFQKLVTKYFIENTRRVALTMIPDALFTEKQRATESKKLEHVELNLSEQQKNTIREKADELKKFQEKEHTSDASSILPGLTPADISKDNLFSIDTVRFEQLSDTGNTVIFNPQITNDIVYLSLFTEIDITKFPDEFIDYLPFFTSIVTKLGAGEYDKYKLSELIDQDTGGIQAGEELIPNLSVTTSDKSVFRFGISLESDTAFVKVDKMLHLIQTILLSGPHWNETDYIMTVLEQTYVQVSEAITSSGNAYAESLASSQHSTYHSLAERIGGLHQVQFLEKLLKHDPVKISNTLQVCL